MFTASLMGAALIITSAYLFGCSIAATYKNRVRYLEEFLLTLEIFKAEINFGVALLPEVFQSIAQRVHGPVGQLFMQSAAYLEKKEGLNATECWHKALQDRQDEMELAGGQMELLNKMGLIWGRGDKKDQLKQVTLMQELLRQALLEAKNEQGKNEKVWRYLGLLGGLTIVILLL